MYQTINTNAVVWGEKCAFPQNLRDPPHANKIRSFVAYPGSARATPNQTSHTKQIALPGPSSPPPPSPSPRRLHPVVVVVLLLCVQNVPQITQNLIRFQPTTKNTRTHNPPPPPSILPTNQSTKSMSSDFDDDIDFDPDDLTILLHFFRKL